jgi:hypothetical protein
MHPIYILAAGLAPGLGSALSRRAVDCIYATTPGSSATCESFGSSWGLSVGELQELNPGITCPDLDPNVAYCVIGTVTEDPPGTTLTTTTSTTRPPTTTTTTTSTTTTTTTRVTTTTTRPPTTTTPTGPTPTMPGTADNCDGFYKVSSGDLCSSIAQKHGVTVAQLRGWNSEINTGKSSIPHHLSLSLGESPTSLSNKRLFKQSAQTSGSTTISAFTSQAQALVLLKLQQQPQVRQ